MVVAAPRLTVRLTPLYRNSLWSWPPEAGCTATPPSCATPGGGSGFVTLTAVGPAQVVDWLPTTPVGGFTKADAVAPMPGAKAPVLHTLRGGGRA